MGSIYTKTRELTAGNAGAPLSESHLASHDNIDSEIQDISTALTAINFTDWATFDPTGTYGGFSAEPTVTSYRWMQIGNVVHVQYKTNAPGTSNSTGFSIRLPKATKYACDFNISRGTDNTALIGGPALGQTTAGGNTLTLFKDNLGNTWTNSGTKSVNFNLTYEVV